ncbi:MAG: hypothetical protein KJ043_17335 [Anaerolineae bacterium]|nr:hypothetical protein [Anaerolineae bacterium]
MSFRERENLVYLVSNIVVSTGYFLYIAQRYVALGLDPSDDLSFWGSAILVLVPVFVVTRIIIRIIFSIINAIITQEEEPDFLDEFDNLIELKSTQLFYHVFMFGFFISIITLVLDMPPFVMFNILMLTIIIAGIVGDMARILFYRRGV